MDRETFMREQGALADQVLIECRGLDATQLYALLAYLAGRHPTSVSDGIREVRRVVADIARAASSSTAGLASLPRVTL